MCKRWRNPILVVKKELRKKDEKDKKYSSGMTDTDIDKLINSKEFEKSSSSFIDKKRGGKVGK